MARDTAIDLNSEAGLVRKVERLRRPESYPEGVSRVEDIETHMSWVFLTERHAYKLKKPVRYPYLDFGTPAMRRADCEAEVRLNRRLAGDVYLGVVALTADEAGELRLEGAGSPVDWLVKMRRLPAGRMLDRLIEGGGVTEGEVRRVAEHLARFYARQPAVEDDPARHRRRFERDIEEWSAELDGLRGGADGPGADALAEAQLGFLTRRGELIDERVRVGRIVDAHGDLRPEHVCVLDEPVVIDCLEFNDEFRVLDPADELAYLSLECERLGAGWIGEVVFEVYEEVTGDGVPDELVSFYKSFRACLRAKIALWHTNEVRYDGDDKWVARARRYVGLAGGYCV